MSCSIVSVNHTLRRNVPAIWNLEKFGSSNVCCSLSEMQNSITSTSIESRGTRRTSLAILPQLEALVFTWL